ncbi:glycosyl transferase family 90-domain-containing protein [Mycena leptocephala]|nr:glycosyl transferase family 90-domain-containing protein [Mycena leptocephala]
MQSKERKVRNVPVEAVSCGAQPLIDGDVGSGLRTAQISSFGAVAQRNSAANGTRVLNSRVAGPRRRQRLLLAACGTLVLLVGSSYLYFGPSAGLPIPDRLAPYYTHPMFPGAYGGNAPPPAHGSAHDEHPHPGMPPGGRPHRLTGRTLLPILHPIPIPIRRVTTWTRKRTSPPSSPPSRALPAARARYTLKTSRPPPRGFDAFFTFAQERGCGGRREKEAGSGGRLEGKGGRGWFRERVEAVEKRLASDSHGIAALAIRDGRAHKPEQPATYFDGDWEGMVNKFASALPPMTVLINGRDEPRVVFDVGPLFEDPLPTQALTLTDPTPFTLSPPRTGEFFAQPERAGVCRPARGVGGMGDVPFLVSASSAEFTTDLVPVLSMTKLADASTAVSGGDNSPGGGSCFADVMVPGEFYYRNSWWAGKFEYPNNVKWEDKKDVLYWRGKSNGGHIRGTNYHSFPRFRLMDLAALPENRAKGLFDVRITQWHESHCTDDCDADAIRNAYKITGESVPREEAYQYKYLLDVDGNTFSGRYLGLLRSGGLVFKSTAFAEFFTPWLVPYEHFIPVRPDLADLPAKIEWARANDGEARRIQESGRVFAERILTDAQNDCYWFAVLLEWGALWGEGSDICCLPVRLAMKGSQQHAREAMRAFAPIFEYTPPPQALDTDTLCPIADVPKVSTQLADTGGQGNL